MAALAFFANATANGFALDDIDLVQRNPRIAALSSVPQLFAEPYWPGSPESGLHRPVTIASFAINHALSGPGPLGFHVVNVALHALVCCLVWLLGRRIETHTGTALACALLFAAHPLHSEAVANIAGRAELLAALGVLTAWLCHLRATRTTDRATQLRFGIAATLAYLAAVLSKEHAVMAPALFLIHDQLRQADDKPAGPSNRWLTYGGYAVVLGFAGLLRYVALGGFRGAETTAFLDNPAAFAGTWPRIATALWVQVKYVGLLLWPARLSSDYSFNAIPVVDSPGDPRLWLAVGFTLVSASVFVWAWRRSRPVAIGLACWFLFFLPSSNLLFGSGTVMAERLAYLPSLGACLIIGHALAWLASERSALPAGQLRTVVPIAILVLATLGLGGRAIVRNPAWQDNATLAHLDAAALPQSAKLQAGAGIASAAAGDTAAAIESFRRAIEIYPDYAQVRFNLGQLLLHRGDTAGGMEHLARAVELSPGNPRPYKRLAPLYEQAGDRQRALAAYAAGTRLDPSDLPLRFNYGRALLAANQQTEGLAVLQALAEVAPSSVSGQLARALSAETRGERAQAETIYRELLERGDLSRGIRDNVSRRLAAMPERR